MASLANITRAFRRKIRRDGGLDQGTLKFDFGADGCVFIDGNSEPNTVSNSNGPADCTLTTSIETLEAMITGTMDGVSAFENGRITVEGDLRIAMAAGPIGVSRTIAESGSTDWWTSNGDLKIPFTYRQKLGREARTDCESLQKSGSKSKKSTSDEKSQSKRKKK